MKTIEELRAAVIEAAKRQLEAMERVPNNCAMWIDATDATEAAVRALNAAEAEGEKQ